MTEEKIKLIIADDNPGDISILKDMLGKLDQQLEIVGEAYNGPETIQLFEEKQANAILLDIDMPGSSGVDVANILLNYEKAPLIAFITGRSDKAVDAFELSAIDYVVKPFDADRLSKTIDKIQDQLSQSKAYEQNLTDFISKLSSKDQKHNKLAVKDYQERTIRFIDPQDIIYVERRKRQVVIKTTDNEFPTYFTIDKLEHRLTEKDFFRANQGALVNINYVEHMVPNGDGTYDLLLNNIKDKVVNVSRSYSKSILSKLSV